MKGKYDTLRVEEKPGDLLLATLDRPEVANAFNTRAALDLCEFLESLEAERRCRRVVLTGAGATAFRAGADGLVARAGEHDAAAPPLGLEAFEKLAEVERSPRVEGVGDLGPVEGRQKQVTGLFLHPQRVVFSLHAPR